MTRERKALLGLAALALLCAGLTVNDAAATPEPNSAVIIPRVFNDCPQSEFEYVNNYPAMISMTDNLEDCIVGFANLHLWRFSEDGMNPILFQNNEGFLFRASLVIGGTGHGEAGLQIAPWWSQADGRFNVRTTDGEIAVFGGRLPFYSFTGEHGVSYTKGEMITLSVEYEPNELTEDNPGTIQYRLDYQDAVYNSPVIPFDMGNPGEEDPWGLWGILNDAQAGGYALVFIEHLGAVTATWTDITFETPEPTAVQETTWGRLKSIYGR